MWFMKWDVSLMTATLWLGEPGGADLVQGYFLLMRNTIDDFCNGD